MKYFLLIFVLSFLVLFQTGNIFAIIIPTPPDVLFNSSDTILVGKIKSIEVNQFNHTSTVFVGEENVEKIEIHPYELDYYTIEVEEFVKNAQNDTQIVLKQPTTSGPGVVIPTKSFKIGDRVLFYVKNLDQDNTYRFESFVIPEKCNTFSVLHQPKDSRPAFHFLQNNTIVNKNNFTANLPISLIDGEKARTLFGEKEVATLVISKLVDKTYWEIVYNKTKISASDPCEWMFLHEFDFILDEGRYQFFYNANNKNSSAHLIGYMTVLPEKNQSHSSSVNLSGVYCPEEKVIIKKLHYDEFVCVTLHSYDKLIERGWQKPDSCNKYACNSYNFD